MNRQEAAENLAAAVAGTGKTTLMQIWENDLPAFHPMLTHQGLDFTPIRRRPRPHSSVVEPSILPDPFLSPSLAGTNHCGSSSDPLRYSSHPSSILVKCFGCSPPFRYLPAIRAQKHTKLCISVSAGVTLESSVLMFWVVFLFFIYFHLIPQCFIFSSSPLHHTTESQANLEFQVLGALSKRNSSAPSTELASIWGRKEMKGQTEKARELKIRGL